MRGRVLLLVWSCLAMGLLSGWSPARAAAFGDCAPIGTLENFEASAPPQTRVFAAEAFRELNGSDYKTVEKSGKTCLQHYALKQGVPRSTDLEIMQNYAEGLPGLGFRIANPNRSPDDEIFATMTQGGVEFWAHVWPSNGNGLHILVLQVTPFVPTLAPAVTAADCAPIRALQDFASGGPPQTRTFAAENFRVFENNESKSVEKSGDTCLQHYALKPGIPYKTDLEIMQNYAMALPQEGWTIANPKRGQDDEIFATLTKDGVESWVHVWASNGNGLHVLLLRIQPFRSTLAPAVTAADCAPIRALQDFVAGGPPQTRTFAAENFRVVENNAGKTIAKSGATCLQHYALKPGIPNKTDLEIVKNYALALPTEGWTVTNTQRGEDDEIFATQAKDGVESWVHVWPSNGNGLHVLLLRIQAFQPSLVPLTAQDCAPIRGLRDFATGGPPQTRTFAAEDFRVVENNAGKTIAKSGATCLQHYALKPGIPTKTSLEVIKNYAEALPQEGWTITNPQRGEDDDIFATQTKDGVESWVHAWASNGNGMHVLLLRVQPFEPSLAPLTAQDCAPIRGLRDFAAGGPPVQKPFDSLDFRTVEDGQAKTVTKTGKTCRQDYTLKPGIPTKTSLEVIKNYAEALPQEGWTITNPKRGEDDDVFATQTKDGVESWVHGWASNGNSMHVALLQIAPFKSSMKPAQTVDAPPPPPSPSPPPEPPKPAAPELTLPAPAATPEPVRADQGDFPYLPSVPGSTLTSGREDSAPFFIQPSDAKQPELVANGSILKEYQSPPGLGLGQLLGLYHTALLRAHWTIVNEFHSAGVEMSAHYGENGRNIWATLHLAATAYSIRVADATIAQKQLAADLGSKCHLALTGVLFDFNKSTLKPESDAVLRQVAMLMTQDPVLKLEIQGHTDNVGSDAYNQPLSEARAHAVVIWLTQHSVAPARLGARGYGKTRPITTNATDEGRAQNRRVEIADPACKM
jgi:outer membrane protein OmpA-like peptidoglycan-associated protein